MRTWKVSTVYEFNGMSLHSNNTITCGGQNHPVAGVTATVETVGEVTERGQARLSVTRMALLGPLSLAAPKRKTVTTDSREMYITVTGPDFEVVRSADPKLGYEARQFAAHVNAAGRESQTAVPGDGRPGGGRCRYRTR